MFTDELHRLSPLGIQILLRHFLRPSRFTLRLLIFFLYLNRKPKRSAAFKAFVRVSKDTTAGKVFSVRSSCLVSANERLSVLSPLAGLLACAVSHTFIQLSSSAIGLALAFRRFFQALANFRANIGNAIPQRKVCLWRRELNLWMSSAPSTLHVGYPSIPERIYQLLRSAVSPDHPLRDL